MNAGDFMDALSGTLFDGLARVPPTNWASDSNLRATLDFALRSCCYNEDPLSQHLRLETQVRRNKISTGLEALDGLVLSYATPWPINLVVTPEALGQYSQVFTFFLRIKRVTHSLKQVWRQFMLNKRLAKRDADEDREQEEGEEGEDEQVLERENSQADVLRLRQQILSLQCTRHRMLHVVDVISGYLITQVLDVQWATFLLDLERAKSIDAVRACHDAYMRRVLGSCFLTERASNVFLLFTPIFQSILDFHAAITTAELWRPLPAPLFKRLTECSNKFNSYTHFLYDVLSKLAEKGFANTADLVARLDFNQVFQQEAALRRTRA
jgi:hypothetical protein